VLSVGGCNTNDSGSWSDSADDTGSVAGLCICIDPWPGSNGAELDGGRTTDDDPRFPPHHLSKLSDSFTISSHSSPRFPNAVITSFGTCTTSTRAFLFPGVSAGAARAKLMVERIRRIRGTVLHRRIFVGCVTWIRGLFSCRKKVNIKLRMNESGLKVGEGSKLAS
jgi:hypothetical protein